MTVLNVAEYAPDAADLDTATDLALNVIPRTSSSYGPFSSLAPYSSSVLDGQCLGMISVADIDASVTIFAGTSDKLYQMTGTSVDWDDASVTDGYSTVTGDVWHFVQYNRKVFATNYADPIQTFTLGTSTDFADLSADAPKARVMAVVKNFLMVGDTNDSTDGKVNGRLWWSSSGDPTSWPTPGSSTAQQNMSDFSDLVGPMGGITQLLPNLNGIDVAIFFERGIWRGAFVGPPAVFNFFPVEGARGCRAPNSIVQMGGVAFYLSDDGFYMFDGSQSVPIGTNKVDKTFWADVNQAYLWSVIGAADPINKLVMWIYPSNSSTGSVPDSVIMYRWDIQRWSKATMSAEWIARALSFGVTMDGMEALGFDNLDTLPYSLDSRIWTGGALSLGAVDSAHKLAFFNGDNLEAQIGTQAIQVFPNKRAFVQSARPLVDGGTPKIAMSARTSFYDAETFGTDVTVNSAGECPQRSDGRYHRARITVPASSTWSHCRGVDLTAIEAGTR